MQAKQNKEYIYCINRQIFSHFQESREQVLGKTNGVTQMSLLLPSLPELLPLDTMPYGMVPFISWNLLSWMCPLTALCASPVLKHLRIKNFSQYLSFVAAFGSCSLSVCSALLRKPLPLSSHWLTESSKIFP